MLDRRTEGELVALNADVVGYSRLMADDLDATSDKMVEARRIVGGGLEAHGGHLVNFVGDNFMATFTRAIDAVQAAIEITQALESANSDRPASARLRFRMGIDRGPVTVSDGHFEGDTLNIAARIQALAPLGGLAVSARVYRDLDEPALRFRSTGSHRLKNIPESLPVFEFVGLPSEGAPAGRAASLSLEQPTIAVLPVHAEVADSQVRTAAEVIRADLVHRLAAIPDLILIDAAQSNDREALQHTARYMLETGVHHLGKQLRIYATLFDVATMNVVKSHKLVGAADELPGLSDQLSENVGRSIEVELVVGAPAGLYAELDDPAAIEKVYLGWHQLLSNSPEGWRRALGLFAEVAEMRPDLPYGWVLSAFANWAAVVNGWAPSPARTLAEAAKQARQAASLGDPTGMARAVEAAVLMSSGRVNDAIDEIDTLEIERPTCDVTYGLEGSVRRYLGEWEKAVELLDHAMNLTAVNKPWYPTVKSSCLLIGGRLEEAASVAESVLEHQPHNLEAMLVLAAAQVELGLERRARATAERIRDEFPSLDVGRWLDRNPYQDRQIVERWKADLAAAGLFEGPG